MDLIMPQSWLGQSQYPQPEGQTALVGCALLGVGGRAALLHFLPLTSLCSELAYTECARLISSSKLREPSICPFIFSNASLYLY